MEGRLVIASAATECGASAAGEHLRLLARTAWIVVRVLLALLFMQGGATFFYQGF